MLLDKITKRVKALNLNLNGKVVLTEVASAAYIVTPIIAGIAGAKVYAFSKDSKYGKASDIFDTAKKYIKDYPLDIEFIDKLTPEIISQVDIITNSGHLRPLDNEKLRYAKDSLVIPLMYEAWEFRNSDLDINYIRERGFKLGATNERHPEIDVFNYLGDMATKLIFDAGLCPYRNKFVVIANNDFGYHIANVLAKICDGIGVIDTIENKQYYNFENIEWLSNFPEINIPEKFRDAEAIIFTSYPFTEKWIGDDLTISAKQLKSKFNNPFILRYAGDIDTMALDKHNIKYFPSQVKSGHMGILPSEIGFDPIIRLQSGGLKVGECLLKNEDSYKGRKILEIMN